MSDLSSPWADRAAKLRLAFDRSFAERPKLEAAAGEDFLAVRLGAAAHAIRLSEISGLVADKRIINVPGRDGALLGIAGFRGAIVPVYGLQMLLGYPMMVGAPRWLVIASGAPVAFALDAFEGHFRVSRDAILSHEAGGGPRDFVREVVSDRRVTRSIVHLPSAIDALKKLALQVAPKRNDNV
jgi:chemotaxis signal transduction protein